MGALTFPRDRDDDASLPDDDAEALSIVTAALYDAALDRDLWPAALGLVSRFVRTFTTAIYEWVPAGVTHGMLFEDGRLDPAFTSIYFERYSRVDPVGTGYRSTDVEDAFRVCDILDRPIYELTEFYREWAQPQGIVDLLATPVRRTAHSTVVFGAIRNERDGLVDDAMRRRTRLIAPHVRRALGVYELTAEARARSLTLEDSLDELAAGLFVLDPDGRIVHSNAAGEAALSSGAAVALRNGRLELAGVAARRELAGQLASSTSPAQLGQARPAIPIAGRDGDPFVAHLLPLRREAAARGGVAAVFVHPADFDAKAAAGTVARAFGLTAGEKRALAAIAEADSAADAAQMLAITEATMRTHLRQIFAKTGTSRQAELIKLLAGFRGPLRS